jgi:hypothetical protein
MALDPGTRAVVETAIYLVVTVGLLGLAAALSGRRVPFVSPLDERELSEDVPPSRRSLAILACIAVAVFLQAGIVITLADPPGDLTRTGRAFLVAELVIVGAWALVLALRRPRRGKTP